MTEAETYARMLHAHGALVLSNRTGAAVILFKAMSAMADDYEDRTDGNLHEQAMEVMKQGLDF